MGALQVGQFFLAAVLILLAPGSALLAWLPAGRHAKTGLLAGLADAVALSIAIPALLALWLFVLGVQVSGIVVASLYGLCLLLLIAAGIKRGIRTSRSLPGLARWAGVLLSLIFVAVLIAWRFYQARTLVMPAWVDSVQHALITRKIFEYGGLPPDLSPYLPAPFFYHYGYHVIAALFVFWSGIPVAQATLWFGQVLNALVAISVYRAAAVSLPAAAAPPALAAADGVATSEAVSGPQAERFPEVEQPEEGRRRAFMGFLRVAPVLAAALAALLVGFDFQMPAYYLTWGRYTMLSGLLLLGPTLATAVEARIYPQNYSAWIKVVLLVAGLCVTHYFVLLLAGLFLIVFGLFSVVQGYRSRECWLALARLAGLVLIGGLLASPWIWRVWFYNQQLAQLQMILPQDQSEVAYNNTLEYLKYLGFLIGPRRNHILLGIAAVGVLAAAFQPRLYALAGWGLLLGLLSLPWGLRIGPFRPDHFAIVLFFPAAILVAELLVAIAASLARLTIPWVGSAVVVVAAGVALAWGLRDTQNVVNNATVFITPADVAALNWVNEHTPLTARFYINSVMWQSQTYRGVDGGAWLLPSTGRYSLVPPISYSWESPDNFQQINGWAARSSKLQGCTTEFWNLVRDANLNYIYLRKGQSSLQPEKLAGCQGLRPVYEQGGVFIYQIEAPR